MNSKKKIRFIINPISGVGKQKVIENLISTHLDNSIYEPDIQYTEGPGHATEISREAVNKDYYAAAAIGGDGSVNEVGKALKNTNTRLAIIPAGSGNGLARHLRIPLQLPKAVQSLNKCKLKKIDTGTVNNEFFAGTAGIGFDAFIGNKFASVSKRGFQAYIKLVFNEYLSYKQKSYALTIDGKDIFTDALMINFANIAQFGNNAKIAPEAVVDDGFLEVCVFQKIPLASTPAAIIRLFTNSMKNSKFRKCYRAKEIKVKMEDNLVHLDGEPREISSELEVTIEPLSLGVLI